VIRWFAEGLLPLSAELCGDARLAVIEGDVYARLWQPSLERWDVILIDVDHSPDEPLGGASDSFYTQEGLRRAKRHLAPSGVLGVWSYAECSPFADALARVFAEVRVERVSFENRIVAEKETNWLFFARG
jgi:spermidine synthase